MAAFFFSISEFFLSFCADPDIPGSRCTATARAQSARPAPRRRNRVYYTPSALKKQDVFKKKSLRIAEVGEAGERRGKRWGTLERVPQTPQNFYRINLLLGRRRAGSKENATLSNRYTGTNQCRAGSDRGAGGGAPGKVN